MGVEGLATAPSSLDFRAGVADRGGIQGAEVKSQGIVEWKSECQSLQDVVLSAKSAEGNLSVAKLTWKKEGAWAWEGGRFSRGMGRMVGRPVAQTPTLGGWGFGAGGGFLATHGVWGQR